MLKRAADVYISASSACTRSVAQSQQLGVGFSSEEHFSYICARFVILYAHTSNLSFAGIKYEWNEFRAVAIIRFLCSCVYGMCTVRVSVSRDKLNLFIIMAPYSNRIYVQYRVRIICNNNKRNSIRRLVVLCIFYVASRILFLIVLYTT